MKHTPIILLLMLLLMGCGNKLKGGGGAYYGSYGFGEENQEVVKDSVAREKDDLPDEKHNDTPMPSKSDDEEVVVEDNMRGFDPASEDDMEDNGMRRYMENNDEEGWD